MLAWIKSRVLLDFEAGVVQVLEQKAQSVEEIKTLLLIKKKIFLCNTFNHIAVLAHLSIGTWNFVAFQIISFPLIG